MTVEQGSVQASITETCSTCRTRIVLPDWVSQREDADAVLFQCPNCDGEREIDITDYPQTFMRIVVNDWEHSVDAQGGRGR